MSATNLVRRLPRGFNDYIGREAERCNAVICTAFARGRGFGCEPLITAPVIYRDILAIGRNLPADRIFAFPDRAGRELVLNPDSTVAVLRWLAEVTPASPERLCFVNPTFRYRRQKRRHFHQIGFCIAGEPNSESAGRDETALELARQGLCLLRDDFGIDARICVQDFALWHRPLRNAGWSPERIGALLHQLRKLSLAERKAVIEACGLPKEEEASLLVVASLPAVDATNWAGAPPVLRPAIEFARLACAGDDQLWSVDMAELRTSELQTGIAFTMLDSSGQRCGDGGCYSAFAGNFDARIKSYKSFCSGVEWIASRWRPVMRERPLLAFIALDIPAAAGTELVEQARQAGFDVMWRRSSGKLARDLGDLPDRWTWAVPVGSAEFESDQIRLIDRQGQSQTVALPAFERILHSLLQAPQL